MRQVQSPAGTRSSVSEIRSPDSSGNGGSIGRKAGDQCVCGDLGDVDSHVSQSRKLNQPAIP